MGEIYYHFQHRASRLSLSENFDKHLHLCDDMRFLRDEIWNKAAMHLFTAGLVERLFRMTYRGLLSCKVCKGGYYSKDRPMASKNVCSAECETAL